MRTGVQCAVVARRAGGIGEDEPAGFHNGQTSIQHSAPTVVFGFVGRGERKQTAETNTP